MNPKFFTVDEANALIGFLETALERQVFERAVSCFGESRGRVHFSDDDLWRFRNTKRPQNPVAIVVEGVRRRPRRRVGAPKRPPIPAGRIHA